MMIYLLYSMAFSSISSPFCRIPSLFLTFSIRLFFTGINSFLMRNILGEIEVPLSFEISFRRVNVVLLGNFF